MADAPCVVGARDMNCYNYNCSGSFSMQTSVFQREESELEHVDEQDEESVLTQPPIISESDDEMDEKCYYSIKLINPDRKSEYSVEKRHIRTVFKTVTYLTMKMREKYAKLEPCKELRVD